MHWAPSGFKINYPNERKKGRKINKKEITRVLDCTFSLINLKLYIYYNHILVYRHV
jgi:hypothetical protein